MTFYCCKKKQLSILFALLVLIQFIIIVEIKNTLLPASWNGVKDSFTLLGCYAGQALFTLAVFAVFIIKVLLDRKHIVLVKVGKYNVTP